MVYKTNGAVQKQRLIKVLQKKSKIHDVYYTKTLIFFKKKSVASSTYELNKCKNVSIQIFLDWTDAKVLGFGWKLNGNLFVFRGISLTKQRAL